MNRFASVPQPEVERQSAKHIVAAASPGDEDVVRLVEFVEKGDFHAPLPLNRSANARDVDRSSDRSKTAKTTSSTAPAHLPGGFSSSAKIFNSLIVSLRSSRFKCSVLFHNSKLNPRFLRFSY